MIDCEKHIWTMGVNGGMSYLNEDVGLMWVSTRWMQWSSESSIVPRCVVSAVVVPGWKHRPWFSFAIAHIRTQRLFL